MKKLNLVASTFMILMIVAVAFEPVAHAATTDVYIVFSGKHKNLKAEIKDALPKKISVKTYNVDLLAVADYSGVQKAVSKIDSARNIIIVGDIAAKYFKKSILHGNVLMVNVTKKIKKPVGTIRYILEDSQDASALKEMPTENIASDEKLSESKAQVLLLDKSALKTSEAVKILLNLSMLKPTTN